MHYSNYDTNLMTFVTKKREKGLNVCIRPWSNAVPVHECLYFSFSESVQVTLFIVPEFDNKFCIILSPEKAFIM